MWRKFIGMLIGPRICGCRYAAVLWETWQVTSYSGESTSKGRWTWWTGTNVSRFPWRFTFAPFRSSVLEPYLGVRDRTSYICYEIARELLRFIVSINPKIIPWIIFILILCLGMNKQCKIWLFYLYSWFGQVEFESQLFSCKDVRVRRPLERSLQFFQLVSRKRGPGNK